MISAYFKQPTSSFSFKTWQENVLKQILNGITILGAPLLIFGIFTAYYRYQNHQNIKLFLSLSIFYTTIYIALLIINRSKASYPFRVSTILLIFYILAVISLANTSLYGDGRLFLFGFIGMTTIFLNYRATIASIIASFITILLAGVYHTTIQNQLVNNPYFNNQIIQLHDWTTSSINFVFIASAVSISISYLVNSMKKYQEMTYSAEELYRTILEMSPTGILLGNVQQKILYANSFLADLHGYKNVAELLKYVDSVEQLVSPSSRSLLAQEFKKLMTTGHSTRLQEFELLKNDGTKFTALVSAALLEKGPSNEPVFIAVALDITILKKVEKALRESEEKYRSLVEQSKDIIFLVHNNRFQFVNQTFIELFGYTPKEIYSKDFHFMKLVAPESKAYISERVKNLTADTPVNHRYELTAQTKNNKKIEVEVSVSLVSYKKGVAIQGILRDITERKKTELHIKKSLDEKKILLKEIHHRVKNNLNIITSLINLQLLNSSTKNLTGHALKICQDRIRSMAHVHDKLYQSDDFSEINFKDYIDTMSKELNQLYNYNNEISIILDTKDIFLDINKAIPCGLIINELFTNALTYAFPHQKGSIFISLNFTSNNQIELIVKDDGIGLPADIDLDHADSLGLKLVSILVNQLEGQIKIIRDNGTLFKIKFPQHYETPLSI